MFTGVKSVFDRNAGSRHPLRVEASQSHIRDHFSPLIFIQDHLPKQPTLLLK